MYRLLYISTARRPLSTVELTELLAAARAKNDRLGVTGMLVLGGRRFLQLLEGEQAVVEPLYEQIKQDPRHFAAVALSRKPVAERATDGWAMGFAHAGEPGLPAIVEAMLAEVTDPAIRAEFSHFAARNAA